MHRLEGVRLTPDGPLVDVTVADGAIGAIEPSGGGPPAIERIVLPALVDLHTHLRDPGHPEAEDLRSGTAAAAAGGYSDVFAMANTAPPTDRVSRVADLLARVPRGTTRVHPVSAVTRDLAGRRLVDVPALVAAGVRVFSDDGRCVADPALVRAMLEASRELGVVFAQHAQDPLAVGAGVVNARVAARAGAAPWPAAGEERVVDRDLSIAADTGGHLHVCHLSTAGSVELIRQAKRSGVRVTCEVTPHHLVLDDEAALRAGGALKVNPPLRAAADVLALRAALADGTIDVVATDHAPHPQATKTRGWADSAFGLTGLETALSVVATVLRAPDTGRVDWARLTEVLSVVPARIGGIAHRAGRPVRVGEPADLCVVETGVPRPIRVDRHRSRSRNNPFGGWTVRERVVRTLVGGRVAH
ncbi:MULTISPECIES: dihydroorotase [Micromonospora]|uniref:dihydroorotase n=1 Tax=Micromonospora TaxID=1873 RepID=UPI001E32F4F7|nr:dihydroorotase [Micromonospora sp. NBRC 110038]